VLGLFLEPVDSRGEIRQMLREFVCASFAALVDQKGIKANRQADHQEKHE